MNYMSKEQGYKKDYKNSGADRFRYSLQKECRSYTKQYSRLCRRGWLDLMAWNLFHVLSQMKYMP